MNGSRSHTANPATINNIVERMATSVLLVVDVRFGPGAERVDRDPRHPRAPLVASSVITLLLGRHNRNRPLETNVGEKEI